jgi:N-acetylmuramoyl-L-alanine amidase
VAAITPIFQTQLPDIAWYQKKLAAWGYGFVQSGLLDEQTRAVLSAFQMKYRPANIDGLPDVETAALLEALTNPNGPLPPVPPAPVNILPVIPPSSTPVEPAPNPPVPGQPLPPAPLPTTPPPGQTVIPATPPVPVQR